MTDTAPQRGLFTGVANIVRFNPRFYLAGICALALAIPALVYARGLLPPLLFVPLVAGTALAAWWLFASLFASWWIYDLSGLYGWEWLRRHLAPKDRRLVSAHAGFDETTLSLRAAFPELEIEPVDFHDPERMTEPSIQRARRLCPPLPGTAEVGLGPWPSSGADLVLFPLSAHEWRTPDERRRLLRHALAALNDGGRIVLLEHLRDLPNFIAFGPGFFHFHSAATWERDWQAVDLECVARSRIAGFLGGFVLYPRHQIPASHD